MNRCLGAELPVVEALSFLDLTESDRFLTEGYRSLVKESRDYTKTRSLSFKTTNTNIAKSS